MAYAYDASVWTEHLNTNNFVNYFVHYLKLLQLSVVDPCFKIRKSDRTRTEGAWLCETERDPLQLSALQWCP